MRWLACILAITGSMLVHAEPRFQAYDLYLDSTEPIAAWQIEIGHGEVSFQVVGIENGQSAAFPNPPYYDQATLREQPVYSFLLADFSVQPPDQLPVGHTRIATIHLLAQPSAQPFELSLHVAVNALGKQVDGQLSFIQHETSAQGEQ